METLQRMLLQYDELVSGMSVGQSSNNETFNKAFGDLVKDLFAGK